MNKTFPKIDGSMEDWLEAQLLANASFFSGKTLMLDVGAYHGDFSKRLLDLPNGPFSEAILFEPNGETFGWLQKNFAGDKRFRIENRACDVRAGTATLFCQGELCTGSLLEYHPDRTEAGVRQTEQPVPVVMLDEFLAQNKLQQKLGMIKVDTQGKDLRVLQGAAQTLAAHRPWIVVEMISTPRFVDQARPSQITQWLEEQNYFFAAQFNEYYTAAGWLAWYDACFVPREIIDTKVKGHIAKPDAASVNAGDGGQPKVWNKLRRAFGK